MKKVKITCFVLVVVLSLAVVVLAAEKCDFCQTGYMQPQSDIEYDVEPCPNPICDISVTYDVDWEKCDFESCGEETTKRYTETSRYHIDSGCPYQ